MEVRQAHLGGPGETSGHSENREPAIIIKTNTTNGTSWLGGALSLAHLIRGTSIISSSNPHELTVQGEREAAPAGVHRVQAVCWPRGPAAPPQGLQPHKGDCAFIPVLSAPPTLVLRLPLRPRHDAPQAPQPRQGGSGHEKGPQSAALPSSLPGTQVPALPSLARSRRPPQEEATLHLQRQSPGTTPLPPGRRAPIASRRQRSSPG